MVAEYNAKLCVYCVSNDDLEYVLAYDPPWENINFDHSFTYLIVMLLQSDTTKD